LNQNRVIKSLVKKYNEVNHSKYKIVRYPDQENSATRDIDAYAMAPGERPLALEHTNIQSFFGQFANNKRFARLYGELETDLKDAFDFRTRLYLPIFMFQKGTNWKQVRDTIRDWLLQNAHSLPDGFSTVQVSGLPFSFAVHKDGKGSKRFTVARWAPEHEDVDVESILDIARALEDKNDQMKKYRDQGAYNILVLESSDIALVDRITLYKAFLQALNRVSMPNIDEVWLASTYGPEDACEFLCFLGPEAIMGAVNPPNFQVGPRHAALWSAAIERDERARGSIDLANYIPMENR
jgi:hypothetical protein